MSDSNCLFCKIRDGQIPAKVVYRVHTYDYDPEAANIGQQAAAALGIEAARMFKTLMIELDGKRRIIVPDIRLLIAETGDDMDGGMIA